MAQARDTVHMLAAEDDSGGEGAAANGRAGAPRSRVVLPVLAGALGFAVAALCFAGPGAKQRLVTGGARGVIGLAASESAPPGLKCEVPADFCATGLNSEDFLSFRDCDGDGHLDPYCEGGQLLRFGYLSSANGCKNNWPNGLCTRETTSNKDMAMEGGKKAAGHEITIIHFNDVYEVSGVLEGGVRRGGMSRAAHVIEEARKRNPDRTFVVFAGDLLSPSVLSDLFEGRQMIDILNYLKLDAASLGNHEFDFGVDVLMERLKESEFPWLNVNLFGEDGELLKGTTERLVRDVPFTPLWGDKEQKTRVCMFGSAYDVRTTMFKDKHRVDHKDTIEASAKEAKYLREEKGCNVVLALTHQFSREDCEMSKTLGDSLDLILGGHDHSTELTTVCGNAPYVKADSDLKTQWIMTLWLDEDGRVSSVDGKVLSLTDVDPFSEGIHDKIVRWESKGEEEFGKPIGCSKEQLDGVAANVRKDETGLGNFFTDSIRAQHKTDVALINGGTIRGNKVFDKGVLSKRTIMEMHPFGNAIAKVYLTGAELKRYIGRQLDCYEDKCGNFLQISGLNYTFSPSAPVGHRLKALVHPDGKLVGDSEEFTVALSDYMLATSPFQKPKLYNMVTLNDAVPIVSALFEATRKAGSACISSVKDGRIVMQ